MSYQTDKRKFFSYIAEEIVRHCTAKGIPYNVHGKIYPDTDNNCDNVIQQLEFKGCFNFGTDRCAGIYERRGFFYLILFGLNITSYSSDLDVVQIDDVNPFIIRSVYDLKVKILSSYSPYEILDSINIPNDFVSEKFYPYSTRIIQEMFGSCHVFKLNSDFVFQEDAISRLFGYFFTFDESFKTKYYEDTLLRYREVFLLSGSCIPFDEIVHSLFSSNFKHCFIELYRVIERLFPIPSTTKLITSIPSKKPLELAKMLEDSIGWRPNESSSLDLIIDKVNRIGFSEFELLKKEINGYENAKVGTLIYKMRCSFVHYRESMSFPMITFDVWNKIVSAMLILVQEIYDEYKAML